MSDLEQSFRVAPPTPEEFLSERYIGSIANYLFPHIKEAFIETFNSGKKHIILNPDIGWGVSMYVVLCNLYLNVLFAYDAYPNSDTPLFEQTQVILVPKKHFEELVVSNYLKVLEESEFFREVDYDTYVYYSRKHLITHAEPLALYYTRESKKYQFRFSSGIDILVIADPKDMVGLNSISIDMPETDYYDTIRKDVEYVKKLHSNCIGRCNTRYGIHPQYGMTFLHLYKDYHPEVIRPYLIDLQEYDKVKIIR